VSSHPISIDSSQDSAEVCGLERDEDLRSVRNSVDIGPET
jgi:hypothetical protein